MRTCPRCLIRPAVDPLDASKRAAVHLKRAVDRLDLLPGISAFVGLYLDAVSQQMCGACCTRVALEQTTEEVTANG